MKKIESYILGLAQVNTYVLWNEQHVLIIDPGATSTQLCNDIARNQGIVDGIILTHGHFDHIGGVDALVEAYHCPVYMNAWDIPMLQDPYLNASSYMGIPDVKVYAQVQELAAGHHHIGAFDLQFLYAPGHSDGCSMIIWDQHIFCGDVLFAGSIGRTDLPGGNFTKMMQSLSVFQTMDPKMEIHPGHGPSTTIEVELQENPYLSR